MPLASNHKIGDIDTWQEAQVDKIIQRYVGRSARLAAITQKLNQHETGT
jgi:hypothetical protein